LRAPFLLWNPTLTALLSVIANTRQTQGKHRIAAGAIGFSAYDKKASELSSVYRK
jgi:hypothetical protein